jgi:hypothetical protein
MCPKVVVPGGVSRATGMRGDDRDPVPVVEIDDRVASRRTTPRATGLDDRSRKDQGRGEPAPSCPQQHRVELPAHAARHEPTEAARSQRRIHADDHARRPDRVDPSELASHHDLSTGQSPEPSSRASITSPPIDQRHRAEADVTKLERLDPATDPPQRTGLDPPGSLAGRTPPGGRTPGERETQ